MRVQGQREILLAANRLSLGHFNRDDCLQCYCPKAIAPPAYVFVTLHVPQVRALVIYQGTASFTFRKSGKGQNSDILILEINTVRRRVRDEETDCLLRRNGKRNR